MDPDPLYRPRVKIPIHGIQSNALIDTGSTHTLIDCTLYSRLKQRQPLQLASRLQSTTGSELCTVGMSFITLADHPQLVIVCQLLGVDLLLGSDFLNECTLN